MQKTIIVTGGSGGLGNVVVKKLLDSNHKVIATVEPGTTMHAQENLEVRTLDVTDELGTSFFLKNVVQKYGHIHAAIMLVGGFAMGNLKETDTKMLDKMIKLNFLSAFNLAKPTFEQMINQEEGGRLIFIGARPALESSAGKSTLAYALSKSLIFNLAEILNEEGKDKNVVSTVIVPSIIDTPANRKTMPDADFNKWVTPDAIAEIMNFVCSDPAQVLRETVLKVYNQS